MLGSDDEIRTFSVTRIPGVDDQPLVGELEQDKVEFAGRIETTFWKDLLFGWVIPLAIMIAIWMFIMRQQRTRTNKGHATALYIVELRQPIKAGVP